MTDIKQITNKILENEITQKIKASLNKFISKNDNTLAYSLSHFIGYNHLEKFPIFSIFKNNNKEILFIGSVNAFNEAYFLKLDNEKSDDELWLTYYKDFIVIPMSSVFYKKPYAEFIFLNSKLTYKFVTSEYNIVLSKLKEKYGY